MVGARRAKPRRRGEVQDRVVDELRRALMVGAFVPGQTISLRKLAEHHEIIGDVRGSGPLSTAMITRLSRIAEQHKLARLTRHGELVLMRTPPTVAMGAANVVLPPGSFLQATVAGEEALAALAEAAALEKELSPRGPPVDPPARELLADLLLALGRAPEAIAAYDTALQWTPLRSPVLLGRARAAARAGDQEDAARWYGLLLHNWKAADPDLPELEEVRAGAQSVRASR